MKNPSYILAIEACSEHLSVCLMNRDTGEISQKSELAFRNLSDNVHPFIQDVLAMAKASPADVSLLACTRGPGSFTSVRVGLATIKGLRTALGIDAVTLPSLELIALPHFHQGKGVTVWLNAHGGSVYVQSFSENGDALNEAVSIPVEEAAAQFSAGNILVGSGVHYHSVHVPKTAIVPERETGNAVTHNALRYGCAIRLAREALKRYDAQTADVNNFDALYVHPLNYDKVGAV